MLRSTTRVLCDCIMENNHRMCTILVFVSPAAGKSFLRLCAAMNRNEVELLGGGDRRHGLSLKAKHIGV